MFNLIYESDKESDKDNDVRSQGESDSLSCASPSESLHFREKKKKKPAHMVALGDTGISGLMRERTPELAPPPVKSRSSSSKKKRKRRSKAKKTRKPDKQGKMMATWIDKDGKKMVGPVYVHLWKHPEHLTDKEKTITKAAHFDKPGRVPFWCTCCTELFFAYPKNPTKDAKMMMVQHYCTNKKTKKNVKGRVSRVVGRKSSGGRVLIVGDMVTGKSWLDRLEIIDEPDADGDGGSGVGDSSVIEEDAFYQLLNPNPKKRTLSSVGEDDIFPPAIGEVQDFGPYSDKVKEPPSKRNKYQHIRVPPLPPMPITAVSTMFCLKLFID